METKLLVSFLLYAIFDFEFIDAVKTATLMKAPSVPVHGHKNTGPLFGANGHGSSNLSFRKTNSFSNGNVSLDNNQNNLTQQSSMRKSIHKPNAIPNGDGHPMEEDKLYERIWHFDAYNPKDGFKLDGKLTANQVCQDCLYHKVTSMFSMVGKDKIDEILERELADTKNVNHVIPPNDLFTAALAKGVVEYMDDLGYMHNEAFVNKITSIFTDPFNEAKEGLAEFREEEKIIIDEFMAEKEVKSQEQRGDFKHIYWQLYGTNEFNKMEMDVKLRNVFELYKQRHNPILIRMFDKLQNLLKNMWKKEGEENNKTNGKEGNKKNGGKEHKIKDILTETMKSCLTNIIIRFAPFRK